MPAPRYEGWTHTRFVGDKDACAALIPTARKVLGYVAERAKASGLGTVKQVQQVPGGTIVAEMIGGQPRITITVEGGGGEGGRQSKGGFILWPRWDVPFGIPLPGRQVDPTGQQPNGWLEFNGGGKITRYYSRWDVVDDIKGARYETFNAPDLYPNGLRYYGCTEWKDGRDLQLSVYNWQSRYVNDTTVLADMGRFVFQQGQVLFDRDEYAGLIESPPDYLSWRINSACLRKSAEGFAEMVVAFSNMLINQTSTGQSAFVAFRVSRREGDQEKGNWEVEAGSHVELGRTPGKINPDQPSDGNTFGNAGSPWFFNATGTKAIRTVTSEQDTFGRQNTITQMVDIGATSISYEGVMADYMVANYASSLSTYALLEPARGLCASDYAGQQRRDLYISLRESSGTWIGPAGEPGTTRVVAALEFDGGEIILMDRSAAQGNDRLDYHLPAYMDLRHNLFAGWRIQGLNGAHTVQCWAYVGGRMEYGEVETVPWDPAGGTAPPLPGLDTRNPSQYVDGIVFGSYWVGAAGAGWGPRLPNQPQPEWRRQPRMGLNYFTATASIIAEMMNRYGSPDFNNFLWAGGWNYYDGRYCVSMSGPYGASFNYLTGGNMGELMGLTADDRRFWPLTVLPKPI